MANPADLSKWLEANYSLSGAPVITLIRSFTNDVFHVDMPDEQYVLKIYGKDWRTKAEIGWEVDLVDHLTTRGLHTAKAVRGSDGEAVRAIQTPLGEHWAVLYKYAAGKKPSEPFTNDLYFQFGKTIGAMHRLSDGFTSANKRKPIDLTYLVDEPIEVIQPYLRCGWENDSILRVAKGVKARMMKMGLRELDWGPIHGDATLDNLHITADGDIVLFDFDSGGPGWRASDLQGWAADMPDRQEHRQAFLSGYNTAQPLAARDVQAARWLTIAWEFWSMKVEIENRLIHQGQERIKAYLTNQAGLLNSRYLRQFDGES